MNNFKLYSKYFRFQVRIISLLLNFFVCIQLVCAQQGNIVVTDNTQEDFLNAYKMIMSLSDKDFRSTSLTMDTLLFPKYGEYSVYWITKGVDKGNFLVPDTISSNYPAVTSKLYFNYNWQSSEQLSLQIKNQPKTIAVFNSKLLNEGYSVSWETRYFNSLFRDYLYGNMVYNVNEDDLTNAPISDLTSLLIIPAITEYNKVDYSHYIDSIFKISPNLKTQINNFLARGGTIYTEGNGAYFIQKLGLPVSIDFTNTLAPTDNYIPILSISPFNPVAFCHTAMNDQIYAGNIPMVDAVKAEIIATLSDNRPAIYSLTGNNAGGGRVICNLGIPTYGGIESKATGSRQLQWALNAIFYAFSHKVDLTRSVYNVLPPNMTGEENEISFDRTDTFEVRVKIRNLTSDPIRNLSFQENLRNCFSFVKVTSNPGTSKYDNGVITFSGISIPASTELSVVYRIASPNASDPALDMADSLIDYKTFRSASINTTTYSDQDGIHVFNKIHNYTWYAPALNQLNPEYLISTFSLKDTTRRQ